MSEATVEQQPVKMNPIQRAEKILQGLRNRIPDPRLLAMMGAIALPLFVAACSEQPPTPATPTSIPTSTLSSYWFNTPTPVGTRPSYPEPTAIPPISEKIPTNTIGPASPIETPVGGDTPTPTGTPSPTGTSTSK